MKTPYTLLFNNQTKSETTKRDTHHILLALAFLALPPLASSTALARKPRIEPTATAGDLRFGDLASVWDEGLPLGNATVGQLVWQKDGRLRFSLDRTDLWDLRPIESFQGEHFSFDWISQHIRSRNYDPVVRELEREIGGSPAPSKIPGAALEFDSGRLGQVVGSSVSLRSAVCEVRWDSGARLLTFVQADRPVGWFLFENVPEGFEPQLLTPDYGGDAEKQGDGGLGDAALARLGYKQGPVTQADGLTLYHQQGWGGFSYDVALGWQRQGNAVAGAWSITSSLSADKAQEEVRQALRRGIGKSFARHQEYWSSFWQKSSITLPDTLLQNQYDREMYKLGSASRPESYPISLQAVWTADDGRLPPWRGDYHHDLNTQLSYWPVYTANHLDEGLAYINTLWAQRPTHKAFTRRFYGKDGLNVPGTCALDGQPIPGWLQYSFSQTTGAWLAQHFYLHWKYSADADFLASRGYPYVKDVATFLEQQTQKDSAGRRVLEFSSSPEINNNSLSAWFTDFTNYDLALTRFAFCAASEMADSLGMASDAAHWRRLSEELPDFALDATGALAISPSLPYRSSHRHFSHAMAIHPLGLLDVCQGSRQQAIVDSTLAGLHRHGPDWWTGYSYSWLGNLEARAKHGDEAAEALRTFAQCFCLRNSFHANGDQTRAGKSRFTYRPFTLEGNFAFAAGVQEMLLQSHTGIIEVFPAVPEAWRDVSFRELRAMGAFLVSAERKGGRVVSLSVRSERGGLLRLRHPATGEVILKQMKPRQTFRLALSK